MKIFVIYLFFTFCLLARENPFLPSDYQKSNNNYIEVDKENETITKRIKFNKIKRINKIVIEYVDDNGNVVTKSVVMKMDIINNYIDISQSTKKIEEDKKNTIHEYDYNKNLKNENKDDKDNKKNKSTTKKEKTVFENVKKNINTTF